MSHVVLCTGHLGSQVREIFGDSYAGLRLDYSQESSPLGTGGALRFAVPLLESESVLIMNGDSFCDADLLDVWEQHSARNASASLVLIKMPDTRRYGLVKLGADGAVLSFEEKNERKGPGWINAGIYLVDRDLLGAIPAGAPMSLEREILPAWIGRGLFGYRSEARFLDIGTPESYASAEGFFTRTSLRRETVS
jgi:NDP-sugar pyrophosphorylase family protein